MAAENLTAISGALAQLFAVDIQRIWNRESVLVPALPVVDGFGKNVAWDVEAGGATAGSFAEGSAVAPNEFSFDPAIPAVLNWGMYRAAVQLTNLEIRATASSRGNAIELANIFRERSYGAAAKLMSVLESDAFAGTGTDAKGNPTLVGLLSALLATGTYAGINTGTYPEWASNILANGGTPRPLSVALLNNLMELIWFTSGETPNLIICDGGTYRQYENLFEPMRRTNDTGSGGPTIYDTGAPTVAYKGIPVLRSRFAPTTASSGSATVGNLFMLTTNTGAIELKPLPIAQAPSEPAADGVVETQIMLPSSNGRTAKDTASTLGATVYPLARVGSAQQWLMEIYLQIAVKRTNCHGVMRDIAIS